MIGWRRDRQRTVFRHRGSPVPYKFFVRAILVRVRLLVLR